MRERASETHREQRVLSKNTEGKAKVNSLYGKKLPGLFLCQPFLRRHQTWQDQFAFYIFLVYQESSFLHLNVRVAIEDGVVKTLDSFMQRKGALFSRESMKKNFEGPKGGTETDL